MADIIKIDNELIEAERKLLQLAKPTEFESFRITPELIEKLFPLVVLPFDNSAINTGHTNGFVTKGVHHDIQYNRLQQIFGAQHILKEHNVIESYEVSNDKSTMYYYKVYVTISIGNFTLYTNIQTGKPESAFVTYYKAEGIGWSGANNKGTAEKNALANGTKEALRSMGMLRYLYIEENDDEVENTNLKETDIEFIDDPKILEGGAIFLSGLVRDLNDNSEVNIIIYRDNKFNNEEHRKMIETLNNFRKALVKGKVLTVNYTSTIYKGKDQYIINKIKFK